MSHAPYPARLDTHYNIDTVRDSNFENARCREVDPETFFPEYANDIRTPVAKEICSRCELVLPCLVMALRNNINHGIWGGYTAEERRAYWKRLQA